MPFLINSSLVKPEEVKSYRNLLEPKWKRKIVLHDPFRAGSGGKWFGITVDTLGLDYLRAFAKQEPVIIDDHRLQTEWVARGKYPMALSTKADMVLDFIKEGAPLKEVMPIEGSYLSSGGGNVALINKAPHPNAAKLYINWFLSQEGQRVYAKVFNAPSPRVDVSIEGIDPVRMLQPGVKYVDGFSEEAELRIAENTKLAKDVFGEVLK